MGNNRLRIAAFFLGMGILVFGLWNWPRWNTPNTPQDTRMTLTFWTLQLRDFAPLIESWISDYEAMHPNQRINWVDVPFSEGEKRALSAMLSPQVPDVINLNLPFSSTLAERQVLEPFTTPEMQGYLPALAQAMQQESGTYYAVPWYTTTKLYFYNTGLMNEAEAQSLLQQNAMDKALLKRLKAKQAYGMYPLLTQGGNTFKALVAKPERYIHEAEAKGELLRLLAPLKRAIAEGWVPREAITGQYNNVLELYMGGRLALLEAGSSALNVIENNSPAVFSQTRILPTAMLDANQRLDASPMVLVVPKRSAHPQEAKAFARFITNTAHQLELSQKAPVLPSTREGLTQLRQQKGTTLQQQALAASAERLLNTQAILPVVPNQAKINDASNALAQAFLLDEPKTYETQWQTLKPYILNPVTNPSQ